MADGELSAAQRIANARAQLAEIERANKPKPTAVGNVSGRSGNLSNAHGGYAGKSLIENIRDDLRITIGDLEQIKPKIVAGFQRDNLQEAEYLDGLVDGMCHALGILRQNDGQTERQWAEAEYRETKRQNNE